jgi:thiosulfate/3-mercaptopyruvate sulfurtransferase
MVQAMNLLPLMIEVEELNQALNSADKDTLLLVDLASEERFIQAHLPGAHLVLPGETQAGPPVPGFAPTDERLTALMQRIGLHPDQHVIVYDDEGGGWAGRFIWLLDEIGHTRYSYLNGGIHAWAASGLPLESGFVKHPVSDIEVHISAQHSVTVEQVIASLTDQSLQIWDARSPMEYRGEAIYAAKGGHIPGALNYEWTNAMDKSRDLRLKPFEQLLKELTAAGIDPQKDTITHCQSHHRSGLTYLLGKLLQFKSIKAYPGSWAEWGNHSQTPTE